MVCRLKDNPTRKFPAFYSKLGTRIWKAHIPRDPKVDTFSTRRRSANHRQKVPINLFEEKNFTPSLAGRTMNL